MINGWVIFETTPSREDDQLLPEEGRFWGVQSGNRAIGLYAPRNLGAWHRCHSAKAVVVWLRQANVDEIWIDEKQIRTLPAELSVGQTLVIGSGRIWTAVHPLTLTGLGRKAQIRLVTIDDHLALEMVNYSGPEKTFWEMALPGSFYQGQPQCGFYLELAEREDYANGRLFAQKVNQGIFTDVASPPSTYTVGNERPWKVAYERDGQQLGLEIDLFNWQLKRRWTEQGELGWPMLDSAIVRESKNGRVQIGPALLTCGPQAAWLLALPEQHLWLAVYYGDEPHPLQLTHPDGTVEIEAMSTGMVWWHNGRVMVEALHLQGKPKIQIFDKN